MEQISNKEEKKLSAINDAIRTAGNEDIQLHFKGYAEPVYTEDSYHVGDPSHGIALANWNHVDESVAEDLSRLGVCLEEWHDFDACCECGKVVRMNRPNSLGIEQSWMKDAAIVDYEGEKNVICGCCVRQNPSEVIDEVLSDPTRCITVVNIDFAKLGFKRTLSNLDRGISKGQDADPNTIADSLAKMGVTRFLFVLDHASGSNMSFSLYVDQNESGLIQDSDDITTNGFSLKKFMHESLQDIVAVFETAEESGMQVSIHADSSLEKNNAIMVTHEESCLFSRLADMGKSYLQEIERIMHAEESKSNEDPEKVWNSDSFRKIVFRNVGTNREAEIHQLRADKRKDFYSAENIRMFYRRVLPSLIQ